MNADKTREVTGKPFLEVKNVRKSFMLGQKEMAVIKGVSLALQEGEFVSIMGPSGSGKSTLLYILGLLEKPTDGKIFVDGIETNSMDEKNLSILRNKKLGFVFQFHFLLPEFTAFENVMMPMMIDGVLKSNELKERAAALLEEVGLGGRLHHKPHELSGGEQQRVAIARAMSNEPSMILADEPTGNLDTENSRHVFEIFQRLNKEKNKTIAFVTHNPDLSSRTDRIIHIVDGQIKD